MKSILFCVLGLSALLAATVIAGPLYGTVRMGQVPAAGVEISVACPGFDNPAQAPPPVVTDPRGSFSLRVPAVGRCEMRVRRGNQLGTPFEVFVSNNALRFDFQIDGAMNRVR
jgi:hypothetical protein